MKRIGKYAIVSSLGEGAFGQVYCARHPDMERHVAIKIINASGDSQIVERFRNEAATTARLTHRNIVTIYDFGEHDGNPFIVMELLEGNSFAELLLKLAAQQMELSIRAKLEMLIQVAEGLGYAHSRGVVHRDIKPANLMRLSDGSVKIVDFGIARALDDLTARRTVQGEAVGTVLYMAPEQFRGSEADTVSDVFSFGVVCYELLTGSHPFEAADTTAAMYRITTSKVATLRERWPDCPDRVDAIVRKALEKNRLLRYQSASDISLDLQEVVEELREEEGQLLFEQARQEAAAGDLNSASAYIRRALECDSKNSEFRRLRDELREKIERSATIAHLQRTIAEVDRLMEERRYNEAIEILHQALLDGESNVELTDRLTKAKEKQRARREAAVLMASAREDLSTGNLESAAAYLARAEEVDEGNPDVAALRNELENALQAEAREARIVAGIAEANRLCEVGSFDRAAAELQNLAEQEGQHPAIAIAQQQVTEQWTAWRRQLLQEQDRLWLAELTGRVDNSHVSEAELESICADLRESLPTRTNAEDASAVLTRAEQLAELRRHERLVQEAVFDAESERAEHPEQALQLLDAALEKLGSDPRLSSLHADITKELNARRVKQEIEQLANSISTFIDQQQWNEALAAVARALEQHPNEPQFHQLRTLAEAGAADASRRERIASALAESLTLAGEFRWHDALQRIDEALGVDSDAPELIAERQRIQTDMEAENGRVLELTSVVDEAIRSGDATSAVMIAAQAHAQLSHRTDMLEVTLRAWRALRKLEVRRAAEEVNGYLMANDFESAYRYFYEVASVFGEEKSFRILKTVIDQRLRSGAGQRADSAEFNRSSIPPSSGATSAFRGAKSE